MTSCTAGLLRQKRAMLNGQKIVVVMPAYNAARTLRQTYEEVMAQGIVDLVMTTRVTMRPWPSRGRFRMCRWKCIRKIAATVEIRKPATVSHLPHAVTSSS